MGAQEELFLRIKSAGFRRAWLAESLATRFPLDWRKQLLPTSQNLRPQGLGLPAQLQLHTEEVCSLPTGRPAPCSAMCLVGLEYGKGSRLKQLRASHGQVLAQGEDGLGKPTRGSLSTHLCSSELQLISGVQRTFSFVPCAFKAMLAMTPQ